MLSFQRRYLFRGRLTFTTALHIGGGKETLSASNSPVLRGADAQPYIPGSSLKGSFRSTVEKLAPSVELKSCALIQDFACPGAPGASQEAFNKLKEGWSETRLVTELQAALCDTCKLFGSHYIASKIFFDDLPAIEWAGVTQIRDGVAIDRDSERAREGLKYDYEVVPPGAVFDLRVTLDEPSDVDLVLACLGISELTAGFGNVGGLRSRGLGRCILEDAAVYALDLTDAGHRARRLRKYLLGRTPEEKMERLPLAVFVNEQIDAFLNRRMGNAQATG